MLSESILAELTQPGYKPLKPKALGLDPTNGVAYNTVIDWGIGLWQAHTRAVGRLYDIKCN